MLGSRRAHYSLAVNIYVAVSMVAGVAAFVLTGFAREVPTIFLVFTLSTARWILTRFQQLGPIARVEAWRQRLSRGLEGVGVPPLLFVGAAIAVLTLNQEGATGTILRIVASLGCFGLLVSALIQVHDERGRAEVHQSLLPSGRLAPGVYLLLMVVLAASFFGAMLSWAASAGWVRLTPSELTPGAGAAFFVWHLLRSIPVLEIADSFGWQSPVSYRNAPLVGVLVTTYKVAVLLPVIAYGKYYWEHRSRRDSHPEPSSTLPQSSSASS